LRSSFSEAELKIKFKKEFCFKKESMLCLSVNKESYGACNSIVGNSKG